MHACMDVCTGPGAPGHVDLPPVCQNPGYLRAGTQMFMAMADRK
jgi:hypothetical protein